MPGHCLSCDLGEGLPAQFRVGPDMVVILPPLFEFGSCLPHRGEQRLVEAFIPEPPDEALHEGILDRLAGSDII